MEFVDLRSDTLTRPDEGMRQAMASAEVGDDVFGEDPTVNLLQEKIAELTGKKAALFVASGTMGNQVSINAHTQPGDEVICEERAHIFNYESGSPAMLSGVQLRPLPGKYGVLDVEEVEEAIRPADHHFPQTRLISLENTHNRWGGTIYPLDEIKKMHKLAKKYKLKMHLDGARLWNASIATGITIKEFSRYFDSVSLCFSKGLGAPVGSVIAGDEDFIERAHRYRKAYGGGMRQAGILAAAAIYAIEHNWQRMADDHRRARTLAETINDMPGLVVNLQTVQTNIVIVDTSLTGRSSAEIASRLLEEGVKVIAFAPTRLRVVTHLHIDDQAIERAIEAFKNVSKNL
ncbi:low-specificity L-threonine aldolase [Calditrichota bacterium LG25]